MSGETLSVTSFSYRSAIVFPPSSAISGGGRYLVEDRAWIPLAMTFWWMGNFRRAFQSQQRAVWMSKEAVSGPHLVSDRDVREMYVFDGSDWHWEGNMVAW
jgi:hypothetical protein